MKSSDGLWHLAVSVMVCSFIGSIKSHHSCPLPDVPAEGNYGPRAKKFMPGDRVSYSCNKGFTLQGKEVRTCMSNRAWSDHTPFCDRPARLKNPRVSNGFISNIINIIDNNTHTCALWEKSTSHDLLVYMDEPAMVHTVRIFLQRGTTDIKISSGQGNVWKDCNKFDGFLGTSQWIPMKCRNGTVLANAIKIRSDNNVTICEIEVYARSEYECEEAPDMRIANGFFEVYRNKAILQCKDGYTAVNGRLVCEYNSWKGDELRCEENLCDPLVHNSSLDPGSDWTFVGNVRKLSPGTERLLQCKPGYQKVGSPVKVKCEVDGTWTKTNATCKEEKVKLSKQKTVIVVIGTVVVLVILLLLGITIYLIKKQRNREVVVVFKPSTDGSMTSGADSEYATGYYESIQSVAPIPPTSPRPSPLLPVLTDGYIRPEDCKTLMKQNPTAADIAFGTLKQSDLYGK